MRLLLPVCGGNWIGHDTLGGLAYILCKFSKKLSKEV